MIILSHDEEEQCRKRRNDDVLFCDSMNHDEGHGKDGEKQLAEDDVKEDGSSKARGKKDNERRMLTRGRVGQQLSRF